MAIYINNKNITSLFPNNEVKITIDWVDSFINRQLTEQLQPTLDVFYEYNADSVSADLLTLVLLSKFISNWSKDSDRKTDTPKMVLTAPYLPFTRMDRETGDQMCTLRSLLSVLNCEIITSEIHNKEAAPFKDYYHKVTEQGTSLDLLQYHMSKIKSTGVNYYFIIFPDAGAYKKYVKGKFNDQILRDFTQFTVGSIKEDISCLIPIPLVGNKKRCPHTGDILSYEITSPIYSLEAIKNEHKDVDTAIIIDDLCEGGRTFHMCAKAFDELIGRNVRKTLCVYHLSPNGYKVGKVYGNFSPIDSIITTTSLGTAIDGTFITCYSEETIRSLSKPTTIN